MNGLQQLINQLCPNGVEWKSLGEVCEFVNGFAFKSSLFRQSGSRIIRITNIDGVNINTNDSIYFDCNDYKEDLSKYIIKEGDIAIAMSGATTGKIGRYIDNDYSYINQRVGLFKPKKCLSVSFLYHFLLSKSYDIYLLAGGGAQPNLGSNSLMTKVKIPLPPLAIQSRIVEILDHFTNLTANLTAELALRRKQFEHFREKLLSLDGVEGVILKKLGEVASIYDGTHQTPKYTQLGIPFISVENIRDIYNSHKYIAREAFDSYKIKPLVGDVFMTRIGSIGECAVFDKQEDIAYYVSLALIRPKECINSCYVKYLLESNIGKSELRKRTLVSAVPIKINKDDISKIQIPVPPLAVQQSIVAKLDKFTALIQNIENELALRQKQYEYCREKLLSFPSPSL